MPRWSPKRLIRVSLRVQVPSQYEVRDLRIGTRLMAVLDDLSGMTDVYALDLYRKINGRLAAQPSDWVSSVQSKTVSDREVLTIRMKAISCFYESTTQLKHKDYLILIPVHMGA